MNFEQLNLIEPLLRAVKTCGYDEPTPIQRETIPPVLDGRDVLGCAQTGTGKTAAFALPILQRLYLERKQHQQKRTIRALILTPTRELALQIEENFAAYEKNLPAMRSCVIFGGVGQQPQVEQLRRGIDILVATPGRLNDLIGQGFICLDHIEIFVLDEADRMLDMGFIHDVRRVIAKLPEKRQTLFFSATMPAEVEKLAMSILHSPVTVKVDPVSSTVDAIEQHVYLIDKANKRLLLASLLQQPEVESALVFSRTKHGADRVVRELSRAGVTARAIHGDKSQNARQEALAQFKSGQVHVMIATDIAARGIDIAGLSHVINYDLPHEPEAYVHRIGRTGRAGREGIAISFCCIDEMKDLQAIEKLIGKRIPRLESQWPMEVFTETVKQPREPRPSRRGEPNPEQTVAARRGSPGRQAPAPGAAQANAARQSGSKAPAARAGQRQSAAQGGSAAPRPGPKQTVGAAQKQLMAAAPRQDAKPGRSSRETAAPAAEAPRRRAEAPQTNSAAGAQPSMRATPLERPSFSAPLRSRAQSERSAALPPRDSDDREAKPSQPAMSYEQYIKQRRGSRNPLATGLDRR